MPIYARSVLLLLLLLILRWRCGWFDFLFAVANITFDDRMSLSTLWRERLNLVLRLVALSSASVDTIESHSQVTIWQADKIVFHTQPHCHASSFLYAPHYKGTILSTYCCLRWDCHNAFLSEMFACNVSRCVSVCVEAMSEYNSLNGWIKVEDFA